MRHGYPQPHKTVANFSYDTAESVSASGGPTGPRYSNRADDALGNLFLPRKSSSSPKATTVRKCIGESINFQRTGLFERSFATPFAVLRYCLRAFFASEAFVFQWVMELGGDRKKLPPPGDECCNTPFCFWFSGFRIQGFIDSEAMRLRAPLPFRPRNG